MASINNEQAFRAYLGPRPTPPNSVTAHGRWDWASDIGDDYDAPNYIGKGTLSSSLSSVTSSGLAVTGLTLPAAGGVWVGPNGAGESWEYIPYHTSGAAILREGEASAHTAGAAVYFWLPLRNNNGQVSISIETTESTNVEQWTAKLSGVMANAQVLKAEHFCLILRAGGPAAAEPSTSFKILCLGIVERVTLRQDNQRKRGEWELDITSIARLLQNSLSPGVRLGPFDIAQDGDASASSSLGAAWKISLWQAEQAAAGDIPEIDIAEFQESLAPDNAVDGNEQTLWISDGWVGHAADFANTNDHNSWASLFVYPPPSALNGSRYIEIISHAALDITWYWVYHKYSYVDGLGVTQWRGRWIQASEPNMFNDQGVDSGDQLPEPEDRLVIAENAEMFRKNFPSANPKFLIDAAILSGAQDMEAVRRLWWEGGAIFMVWGDSVTIGGGQGYLFHWGNVTYTELEDAWDDHGTTDFTLPASNFYVGSTNIKPGTVIRRDFSTTPPDMTFVSDYYHHPGYVITGDIHDPNPEWFKLVLPKMTHKLRDDILVGDSIIYITDAQGNPFVEGISKHGEGGAIIIDDETITFTGKDYYEGKLTGCTIAKKHKANSKVYVRWKTLWGGHINAGLPTNFNTPLKDKVLDLATDAYPLEKLEWGRGYYANGDPRAPYLSSFAWRFSLYEDARTPESDSYDNDYFAHLIVDSGSWTPSIQLPNVSLPLDTAYFDNVGDGFRPKTMLMHMSEMKDADGLYVADRPRLNYVRALVDRRFFNPDTWFDTSPGSGWGNELAIQEILKRTGWYPALFVIFEHASLDVLTSRKSGMTDRDTAWRVASDTADYGSSRIIVQRNGRIQITENAYLRTASTTPSKSLTNADVSQVEVVNVRQMDVGQVRLKWESGDGKTSGAVLWPDTMPKGTRLIDVGPLLADSAADATILAFNYYNAHRFSYNVFVTLTMADFDLETGEIHSLTYDWNRDGLPTTKILYVENVQHQISQGRLQTAVGYREIRETA